MRERKREREREREWKSELASTVLANEQAVKRLQDMLPLASQRLTAAKRQKKAEKEEARGTTVLAFLFPFIAGSLLSEPAALSVCHASMQASRPADRPPARRVRKEQVLFSPPLSLSLSLSLSPALSHRRSHLLLMFSAKDTSLNNSLKFSRNTNHHRTHNTYISTHT